ncbi:hypothetical protein [Moraxella sp.]|uniref:hypothetical protein n=1 Tax=Moraxella sp. TaxID=479 RepID=UPI0026DC7C96|nr:hypothetical protein [Moraxella sp.]MDO4894993.1 hypothetical protein [Moraxella sp.]
MNQLNHAKTVIDQIMRRMIGMGRYSDETKIITADELKPLDVVAFTDEFGKMCYGVVQYARNENKKPLKLVVMGFNTVTDSINVYDYNPLADTPMRTIFETEGLQAREVLMQMYQTQDEEVFYGFA